MGCKPLRVVRRLSTMGVTSTSQVRARSSLCADLRQRVVHERVLARAATPGLATVHFTNSVNAAHAIAVSTDPLSRAGERRGRCVWRWRWRWRWRHAGDTALCVFVQRA